MNHWIAILHLEARQLRFPIIMFNIGLVIFTLLTFLLYPGAEGIKDLFITFSSPERQFFVGLLPATDFYIGIWIQILDLFILPPIMLFLGLFLGIEIINHDEAEKTYDIAFTTPQSRGTIIIMRLLGVIGIIALIAFVGISSMAFGNFIIGENLAL